MEDIKAGASSAWPIQLMCPPYEERECVAAALFMPLLEPAIGAVVPVPQNSPFVRVWLPTATRAVLPFLLAKFCLSYAPAHDDYWYLPRIEVIEKKAVSSSLCAIYTPIRSFDQSAVTIAQVPANPASTSSGLSFPLLPQVLQQPKDVAAGDRR